MRVLGIESSCDETGIAIYDTQAGLLAQALHSQIDLHQAYGGVVPELASRDHIHRLLPLTRQVLEAAGLPAQAIDGVAYTAGPGLLGALLTGACFARALAFGWGKPAIAVHHMEAHLLAPMLDTPELRPPFVALLVSGGHSMLVGVEAFGQYRVLGDTLDDAAGEAFDKVAQLLDLPYPGGPKLAQLAEQATQTRFRFSRPLLDRPGLDFSFSGLKTQVMLAVKAHAPLGAELKAELALGFEQAVVDTLTAKCARALKLGYQTLVVAGGVSANKRLRKALAALPARVLFPAPNYCTDNGAMVALAGALRLAAGQSTELAINARARWRLEELPQF
jgi:N6-L-threonylcarbamoyladenine synthase